MEWQRKKYKGKAGVGEEVREWLNDLDKQEGHKRNATEVFLNGSFLHVSLIVCQQMALASLSGSCSSSLSPTCNALPSFNALLSSIELQANK